MEGCRKSCSRCKVCQTIFDGFFIRNRGSTPANPKSSAVNPMNTDELPAVNKAFSVVQHDFRALVRATDNLPTGPAFISVSRTTLIKALQEDRGNRVCPSVGRVCYKGMRRRLLKRVLRTKPGSSKDELDDGVSTMSRWSGSCAWRRVSYASH